MKKLFLYITLLTLVFIIAFSISEYFFYNHTKNNTKLTATEDVDATEQEETIELPDVAMTEEIIDTINSYKGQETTNYIVTIKNGYIIVYENTVENIYEYTGIDAETIRVTDEVLYEQLMESLVFYTREELFDFLESIAG